MDQDVKRIFMAWPTITNEMTDEASRVLTEEKLVLGESVFKFEEEFAKYIGVDHAISTTSGTTALILINNFLLGMNAKVMTTAHSFIATAYSILLANNEAFFGDINPLTGNIDINRVSTDALSNIDALLPVHLHGNMANMDEILESAEKHNFKVIEDACQAHGAMYGNKKAGSLGDAAAFSFYSTKNMTVGGDGGMITTNNDELAKKINSYRDNGRKEGEKYVHDALGATARLNTVNAAIGRIQLRHIDSWNEERRSIANQYDNAFKNIDQIQVLQVTKNSLPAYHLYPILIQNRDKFAKYMKDEKIECGLNYPIAMVDQPFFGNKYKDQNFPNSRKWASKVVCLPIHNNLSSDDIARVIETTQKFFE